MERRTEAKRRTMSGCAGPGSVRAVVGAEERGILL